MSSLRRCVALVAVAAVAATTALAQDSTTAARDILNKNKESVVTLRLVISQQMSMPGMGSRKEESRLEVTGTVIDATGLTVVSLSETDPASVLRSMMGARGREMQIESQVTDAKIIRADGSEVDTKIVLRDRDLDLAFLRPAQPGGEWPHVDLAQASTPQVLDEIVILSRMGRIANRVYGAALDRVQAVVERPRTFFIPVGADPSGGLGSPAFTLDGKIVGINLLRTIQVEASGMSGTRGDDSAVVVVIPSADIQEAAAQAPSYDEAAKQEEAEKAEKQEQPPAEPAPESPEAGAPEPSAPGAPAPAPAPAEPSAPAPADAAPGEA